MTVMPDSTNAHCRDLLPFYVADLLGHTERETVARHLATCASCQRELAQWQEIEMVMQQSHRQAHPTEDNAASWSRLQSSLLTPDQPRNGKHTINRGARYMEFGNQTAPDVPIAHQRLSRRPVLALVAASLVVILSVVGFVVFGSHHDSSGNVAHPLNPTATATLVSTIYPINGSLVTPNPVAHSPISTPQTSTQAANDNGQLKVTNETAVFHVSDTINVSFKVQGARASDIVSIKWYMNDTDLTPMLLQTHADCCSKVIADDKATDITFGLQVPRPGFGKAEIYYNTTVAYTVVFDVMPQTPLTPTPPTH